MREVKQEVIDDRNYRIYQLAPRESINLLSRIYKVFGPFLSKVVKLFDGNDAQKSLFGGSENKSVLDVNINFDVIGEAMMVLAERIQEAEVERVVMDLLDCVELETENGGWVKVKSVLQTEYTGQVMHLFKIALASAKVNYADFLGGILTGLSKDPLKMKVQPEN